MADYLTSAKEYFGTGDLDYFEEVDSFNPKNKVAGLICKAQSINYGSLFIISVNGKECLQVVRATPKMHYPFDKNGNWVFPKADKILAYEKLDGTNVLLYSYIADDYIYLTYKTRLRPFLGESRFGNFVAMWNLMLKKHPSIPDIAKLNNCSVSFELYGSLNKHLLLYPVPLDAALLFGRKRDGAVLAPCDMQTLDVPVVPLIATVDKQYVENYQWQREQMKNKLVEVEDGYKGVEGQVWYCYTDKGVVQFKCKPEQVEAIHWTQGIRLSKNSVIVTCWNALENIDALTYEFVCSLLLEEFPQEAIDINEKLIRHCMSVVTEEATFKEDVLNRYKESGLSILKDKVATMRNLSQYFPREKMGKVYNAVIASVER